MLPVQRAYSIHSFLKALGMYAMPFAITVVMYIFFANRRGAMNQAAILYQIDRETSSNSTSF